jgi:4-amino-4-deoxy-L-arabinose transferase-like glycosyltransferase
VDFDEGAYVETARQMVRSGDYLTPRVEEDLFFDKPPLVYWTIVAGFRILGTNEWGARLPSALATLLTALLVWALVRRAGRPGAALPAALAFGLGIEVYVLARLALMDAALTLLSTAVLALGYLEVTRPGRPRAASTIGIGVAAGLAILAKGPVGIVLPAAVLGVFLFVRGQLREGLRRIGAGRCAAIAALVASPWFVLMTREHGGRFLDEFFVVNNIQRFTSPVEGHGGPPVYYLAVLLVGFFPWVALLPWALGRAWPRRGSGRGEDGRPRPLDRHADLPLFALLWALLVGVFFSVSGTKLPQYIAPAYPALAVLVGLLWHDLRSAEDPGRALRWPVRILAGLSLALGAVAFATPAIVAAIGRRLPEDRQAEYPFLLEPTGTPLALVGLGAAFGALGIVLLVLLRRRPSRVPESLAVGAAAVLLVLGLLGTTVDGYMMRPLRDLSREAGRLVPPGERVLLLGLKRVPSVGFYADRDYERIRRSPAEFLRGRVERGVPFAGVASGRERDRLERIEGVRIVRRDRGYVLFASE